MDKFVTKEHISWKEEIMCAIWCTMSNDRHNFVYNCSHISVVWLQELNSLQWWLMTSPNLTNVVWVKTILYSYRHIRPKKVKYPIPEIPDDSENKSGMDWVLPKIIGSGRVSGTRQALLMGILHDIMSCWTTLGSFQRPTWPQRVSEKAPWWSNWHIVM